MNNKVEVEEGKQKGRLPTPNVLSHNKDEKLDVKMKERREEQGGE